MEGSLMNYLKKRVTNEDLDTMRAWLVVHALKKKMSPEPVCDFCGLRSPEWLYGSTRLSDNDSQLLNISPDVQCWRWTACAVCSPLIDSERWNKVEDYLVLWLQTRFSEASKGTLHHVAGLVLEEFHRYVIRLDSGLVV